LLVLLMLLYYRRVTHCVHLKALQLLVLFQHLSLEPPLTLLLLWLMPCQPLELLMFSHLCHEAQLLKLLHDHLEPWHLLCLHHLEPWQLLCLHLVTMMSMLLLLLQSNSTSLG
jgi:hypothetical protein